MATMIDHQSGSAGATATTRPPLTDEELLSSIARGDASAVAALYERYSRAVFGVALTVVGDCAEAEEVVQEAFLRVWLRARTYDPGRGRAGTWLLRLTRHLAIDQLRRRRLTLVALESDNGETAWPSRGTSPPMMSSARSCWPSSVGLSSRHCAPSRPTSARSSCTPIIGGLSRAEVAARLGLPLGTVKSRACLGLRRLRELVGRHEDERSATPGGLPRRRSASSDATWLPAAS